MLKQNFITNHLRYRALMRALFFYLRKIYILYYEKIIKFLGGSYYVKKNKGSVERIMGIK